MKSLKLTIYLFIIEIVAGGIVQDLTPILHECVQEWNWDGWGDDDEWCCGVRYTCCGSRQSPMNIDKSYSSLGLKPGNCVSLYNYEKVPNSLTLNNNKYTIQMIYDGEAEARIAGEIYKLERATFHFGDDSTHGSMHTIKGHRAPMEMHLVHYNKKYGSFNVAKRFKDGLLIVAVLFMPTFHDNNDLRDLIYDLHYVMWNGDVRCIRPFPPMQLIPHDSAGYYEYQGSLPFPPCTENVRWAVMHHPVFISEWQLDQFRKMQKKVHKECPDGKCQMWNNYRDPICYNYDSKDMYGDEYMSFYGKELYPRQLHYSNCIIFRNCT
ncbi:hypothetical protein CHUAL_007897 [Chamberlinius hualienensis]